MISSLVSFLAEKATTQFLTTLTMQSNAVVTPKDSASQPYKIFIRDRISALGNRPNLLSKPSKNRPSNKFLRGSLFGHLCHVTNEFLRTNIVDNKTKKRDRKLKVAT